ncbi:MAG: META domain-containing protein [Bacteroidetes bacterium]|nr:META domain-containing protein [Bacteroidota bacterium]
MNVVAMASLVLLIVASCATTRSTSSTASINGRTWFVLSVRSEHLQQQFDARSPQLSFEGDRLSGTGGCNAISASTTIDDTTMRIGAVASTRMMCEALPLEQRIIKALADVRTFSVQADRLYLLGEQPTDTLLTCSTTRP